MQMIKKYWAFILLAFSILLFIYKRIEKANSFYTAKTIAVNGGGWGYEIYLDKKIFIHQENIPGIAGTKSFTTKDDAEKVAEFIIHKMQATKKDLPEVTLKELDSLGIVK